MPYTQAVKTAVFTVHGRVLAAYTSVIGSRTDHVCGPCTAVYTVCTRPWAAVYTGRKHGRVHGHGRTMYIARARPCTVCTRRWAVVYRLCTDCARPPPAVYKLCTRPYTDHTHGPSVSRTRPCTQPVRGKTRPGTRLVPDRVRTVYMAVHVPCTVYTAVYTAVFTARVHGREHGRVHGRVLCTRPCLRPVCTAVYVPCIWPCSRPFTACTDRVHRRARAVYMVRPRPCTGYTYTVGYSVQGLVYGPCTRPLTAVYRLCTRPCTGHVHGLSVTRSRPCTRPVHGRVP